MKDAEGFIAQLNPDLTINRQEVTPSPMLDLVEVRSQEWWQGDAEGKVTHTYYDRTEARKLASALDHAVYDLEATTADEAVSQEGESAARSSPPDPAVRYVAVREVAGGWRVLDRGTWHVLAAIFAGDPEGLEDAERWAGQLNSSADMAAAEKAARAKAGEARAA